MPGFFSRVKSLYTRIIAAVTRPFKRKPTAKKQPAVTVPKAPTRFEDLPSLSRRNHIYDLGAPPNPAAIKKAVNAILGSLTRKGAKYWYLRTTTREADGTYQTRYSSITKITASPARAVDIEVTRHTDFIGRYAKTVESEGLETLDRWPVAKVELVVVYPL